MTPHVLARGIVLAVAACLSGFFSGSETALFTLPLDRVRRMEQQGGTDRVIARLLAAPKRLLTTVLFGNMVVNVVFFSVSFFLIRQLRARDAVGPAGAAGLGAGSVLFVVVFCELLPKNLAVAFARPASRLAAWPLFAFQRLFRPFISALEKITDAISASLGHRLHPEPFLRSEELEMLINLSEKEGVVEEDVGEMLAEVVELSETLVREIMVPRVRMVCFDIKDPPEELGAAFRESKHTLVPVYEGRVDNMLGAIHAKDYLVRDPGQSLRELVRPIPYLPETATVEEALREVRQRNGRMAFVVDEYGAVEGLLTVEDLLEEIVGEITDEFDAEEAPPVQRIDENTFRVRGDLSIGEWQEGFEVEMPELGVDTIGGLVMVLLDRIPRPGDTVRYHNLELTVEKVHGRRVGAVLLTLGPEEPQEGGADG